MTQLPEAWNTAITSWTLADAHHFARRAGFGLNPADAAVLQAQAPGAAIDAWIDGTGAAYDPTAFNAALATADVVLEPLVSANTAVAGSVDVAAVAAPHPFLVQGADTWRNSLNTAQALLAWFFSLAFWLAMRRSGPMDLWDLFGISIWLISVAGETTADSQLARFRANSSNRGTTCRSGLWKYSRHPNYFFEWLHWWTYVAIAWTSPLGWMTLCAPALMLFFLLKVTGIPATEAQALISRGDDYRKYQQTTSMFIPWFPKKFPD